MAKGRGIYGSFPGVQAGDFVVYTDHRGRWRADLVTTSGGNHLTIGPTRGYETLAQATRAAAEESWTRGHYAAAVFEVRDDDLTQIGNIDRSRYVTSGSRDRSRRKAAKRKTAKRKTAKRKTARRDPALKPVPYVARAIAKLREVLHTEYGSDHRLIVMGRGRTLADL